MEQQLTWEEACRNIQRKVRFKPKYPEGAVYEGRIMGVDCPRGEPYVPDVYIVTCRGENIPPTQWETTQRVPVDQVEFLDDLPIREEHILTTFPVDTGIGQQDIDLEMVRQVMPNPSEEPEKPSLLNFHQLQLQVAEWSQANFGGNQIEEELLTLNPVPARYTPLIIELNWMCSLLGIGEEIGEFFMTVEETPEGRLIERRTTREEQRDSLGDIVIYCCDYGTRWGIPLFIQYNPALDGAPLHPTIGLPGALGALMHCNLKRLQKIRGFDDEKKFSQHNRRWLHSVMQYAGMMSYWLIGDDLLVIANETWNGIVKKRNWKKAAKDGVTK